MTGLKWWARYKFLAFAYLTKTASILAVLTVNKPVYLSMWDITQDTDLTTNSSLIVVFSFSLCCHHQKTELNMTQRRARAVKMKMKMRTSTKMRLTPTLHKENILTIVHTGTQPIWIMQHRWYIIVNIQACLDITNEAYDWLIVTVFTTMKNGS